MRTALVAALGCSLLSIAAVSQPLLASVAASAPPIEVLLRSEPKNEWLEPATWIGILGTLGGVAAVLVQRYWHRKDDERSRSRAAQDRRDADERLDTERRLAREAAERDKFLSHVLDSLRWFEGKTQRRSIGIGVVEGNWSRFPELQETWTAVLTNQAVYLLSESNEGDAQHELANLNRIMDLLSRPGVTFTQLQRDLLCAALQKNAGGQGLRGISDTDRAAWKARVNAA